MKKRYAILLALVMLLFAGCSGGAGYPGGFKGESVTGGSASSDAYYAPEAPAATPEPDYDGNWNSGGSGSSAAGADKTVDPAEKIIYTASLSVETLAFDASVAALERLAGELGGFIESSQVSGNTRRLPDGTTMVVDRYAYYSIRVPVSRFQEALDRAGDLGSVTNSSRNADNITSRFTDQEARKHSLEVQEERLLDMLSKAEDVETLIVLESRLSDVRYEIEAIERTLRNWQSQVDYSTVSVTLREVAAYTPTTPIQQTFGERVMDAFSDGWADFIDFLQDLVVFLVGSLPALVLLAAVVIVIVVLIRRSRRKRRAAWAQAAAQPAAAPPVPPTGPECPAQTGDQK